MNKESLFFIKPDEESGRIAQEAVNVAIELGLIVNPIGKRVLTPEEITELYKPFENEFWFPDFMAYMTSGEIQAYLTEGEKAIEKTLEVRRLVREKYARDRRKNAIHSPKTENDFYRNIELFRRVFK